MRLAWASLGLTVIVVACASGQETSETDDDGTVITGAGGSTVATTATSASATSASSSTTGGSGGDGGAGGQPPVCPDLGLGEPNESESSAFPLKPTAISDCDGDGGTMSGTIAGANDVDWFTYEGDDKFGCVVDPTRGLTQSEGGLRLCKYIECFSGNTEFSCPSGTTASTSPDGRKGCCGGSGFDITNLNCTGTTDEHVRVYIRIDQPNATAATCNGYSLSYHY